MFNNKKIKTLELDVESWKKQTAALCRTIDQLQTNINSLRTENKMLSDVIQHHIVDTNERITALQPKRKAK